MQGTKISGLLILIFIASVTPAFTQSDYLNFGNKQYQLLDRLDVKLKTDSVLGFSSSYPYNRKKITERILWLDSVDKSGILNTPLSRVDRYNIQRLLMDNSEWAKSHQDSFLIRKPVFNTFYKTPGHLYAADVEDFTLRVDPLLNFQYGNANDGTGSIYINTRGLQISGNIASKIGFYSSLTENQETDPAFVRNYTSKHQGVPGANYYKPYGSNGYDYLNARGGITFNAGKYIDFTFAYDKLFLGNGYRSLFLGNTGANYLFLKVNTRIWKFNYQNILAELIAPFTYANGDNVRPKKYMAAHYLNIQPVKWLNLGFFENIMYSPRTNGGIELGYLNPVIYFQAAQQHAGSPDKLGLGFDLKANLLTKLQVYSQILLNEFQSSEFFKRGYWRNKQAVQIGVKYVDALGINNLDLQIEGNFVRPYTYSHYDSTTSFTHYNQPLAHPLGANFRELVLLARYQPLPRLYLQGKLIAYKQGLDSAGYNFGSDIFTTYSKELIPPVRKYDIFIGSGIPVNSMAATFNASWEIFENMFIDLNTTYRTYNVKTQPKSSTFFYTLGFRVNLQRREFDF